MTTKDEALKLALPDRRVVTAAGDLEDYINSGWNECLDAIREALAEQPAPPPECKTDAEKTAFAFGWWKALEENRKQPAQQQEIDWKDQYEKQKRRAEMWVAKYEADIGPLEKAIPMVAQQQEPVAWITKNGKGWLRWHKPEDSEKNKNSIPLYTAPTSKPWVGLTDEDLAGCDDEELKQARYWENRLREKNT